jgi:hypothetical protein
VRFLKTIVVSGLVAAGLAVASISAFGATSQTASFAVTVPTTLSITGLAASYSASGAAGTTVTMLAGPLTITTNSSVFAGTGTGTGSNSIALSADTLSVSGTCPAAATCSSAALGATGVTVFSRPAGAVQTDTFSVLNSVAIPATQAPDVYTAAGVTYTAQLGP